MKTNARKGIILGIVLLLAFVVWTVLVRTVDVQPVGVNGSDIGFATVNTRFHETTGVHLSLYTITDWLSAVPLLTCVLFGALGLYQLIKRRSLMKVDPDILLLGVYYVIVILCYLLFEKVVINYRPILIEGAMEPSYPSSTTLLVLSVMPTLLFQINRRARKASVKTAAAVCVVLFSAFMVISRLICGVHWLTDIIGGVLLSAGLYLLYRFSVQLMDQKK